MKDIKRIGDMDYELIEDGKVIMRDGWTFVWSAYFKALLDGRRMQIRAVR